MFYTLNRWFFRDLMRPLHELSHNSCEYYETSEPRSERVERMHERLTPETDV